MISQKIRRAFLDYFKRHGHRVIPSSPVTPHDDPSLLFINAGMNQFKDVFLGKSKRDYTRAATTQKCIRVGGKHNDLENVGHTTRHLTFFEMLGNFSFGDYFKKEAIQFAWEVVTTVFEFDPEKVWASVYRDDDEAFKLWEQYLPKSRIVRFGEKENFWSMGDTGPCGPCSELLYDRGEKYGKAKSPIDDASGERYLEFWNLVFMQFEKDASGKMTPLPKQSIDTGAGLERVVSLKMGVDTVFETDILQSLIRKTEELSGKKYDPKDAKGAPPFHVIADHIRSLSFAIADGVQPSNTDRGYVLRKILRRAVRYGKMLGFDKPFLGQLFPTLLELMGDDFPELKQSRERIVEILTLEEEAFFRTLARGGNILAQVIERSKHAISGDDAFKLKDTYGLPLEEIELIAKDENLHVDLARFKELDDEAREKSRKAQKNAALTFDQNLFASFHKVSRFVGYEKKRTETHITALLLNGKFVQELPEGTEGLVILDETPFYAEMGGQVGDSGEISHGSHHFQVYDTSSPFTNVIAHFGKMTKGALKVGDKVSASIDTERRREIENNHTATHLLHFALEKVLGAHIKQAGSLVEPKRLRFDFSHHKAVSSEELRKIEDLINEKVRSDSAVKTYEIPYEEAVQKGEIKQFFGEKYGNTVRVIDIDFSKELCGGTHTRHVGTIGLFKIVKESSIAAGVRRIEAVTGKVAEEMMRRDEEMLQKLAEALKCTVAALPEKIGSLLEHNRLLEQEMKAHRKGEIQKLVEKALTKREMAGKIALIAMEAEVGAEELTAFAEELLHSMKSGVVALGIRMGERCQLLIAVSQDLIAKNIHAGALIKEVAPLIQGGGGGKQNLAQAGGKDPTGLAKALDQIRHTLRSFG